MRVRWKVLSSIQLKKKSDKTPEFFWRMRSSDVKDFLIRELFNILSYIIKMPNLTKHIQDWSLKIVI